MNNSTKDTIIEDLELLVNDLNKFRDSVESFEKDLINNNPHVNKLIELEKNLKDLKEQIEFLFELEEGE